MPRNKIKDESKDRSYFIIAPQLVWALARNPHDYILWNIIKMIAGEDKECILSTQDLALLAMMSTGQVSTSRKYLLKCGLLKGEFKRDPGYPQPVWHLRIPDLWPKNIAWRKALGDEISKRIEWKQEQKESLHQVKPSPGEEGITPGETKKNHTDNQKEEPEGPAQKPPPSSPDPFAGLPRAYDGHQQAIDKANGSNGTDPVQEVAKHLYWGFEGGISDLPAKKAWAKWYQGGRRLLEKVSGNPEIKDVISRIDAWFADQAGKDTFWHDNPLHDTALDLLARYVKNGGKPHAAHQRHTDETYFDPYSGKLVHCDPATGELVPLP